MFLAPILNSATQLKLTEIKEKQASLDRVLEQDVTKGRAWSVSSNGSAAVNGKEVDFAPVLEDEKNLEATPLCVPDVMYDEDADGTMMDLGFSFGKMRLSDRLGGFFRPKLADEVIPDIRGGFRRHITNLP